MFNSERRMSKIMCKMLKWTLTMKQYCLYVYLPELVSALSGLLDVVMALEPDAVACVAVAAAAKAAKFCIALRPERHTQ